MDGQAVFRDLSEEATSTTVRQINEAALLKALKDMDCDPTKWSQSLESFVDLWMQRKCSLDTVRIKPMEDDEINKS